MGKWVVSGWDGTKKILNDEMPGNLSEKEISRLLQRLVSRDLTPKEICRASCRRNHRIYAPHLAIRIDTNGSVNVGVNPYYSAKWQA